jgi:predicted nucleic-acid-binding Zn-ribbon protein
LGLKDRELEQLQDRWREETKNIHQQTREEINSEREKLIKVIVVQITDFWIVTLLYCGLTPTFQKNILLLSAGLKEFGSR